MVKAGYKQTEVGIIPEDWVVSQLGELGSFTNGINKGSGDFGHGHPFVNLLDVFGIVSISETIHLGLVNSNDIEQKTYDLKTGDVLFIRSSVKPEGVGLTTVVVKDLPRTVYSGFIIRFRDDRYLATEYKKHCFSEKGFRTRVIANSTVSANTNINQSSLKKLKLAYPQSLDEQQTIAKALTDVDDLIVGLERLIAKKRAVKTATMQQLLTGKRRLPGFDSGQGYRESENGRVPSDWKSETFGDVTIECFSGATPYRGRPEFYKGEIPWITSGELNYNVITDTVEKVTSEAVQKTNLRKVPKNTFLMAITGLEAAGTRGSCAITGIEAVTNQSCMAIIPNSRLLTKFLFYYYVYHGEELAFKYCQGTKQQSYTAGLVKKLPILIPSIDEQQAITAILSDMDTEITALEARRAKTQVIKQGMMQELLTGRTRLLPPRSSTSSEKLNFSAAAD